MLVFSRLNILAMQVHDQGMSIYKMYSLLKVGFSSTMPVSIENRMFVAGDVTVVLIFYCLRAGITT